MAELCSVSFCAKSDKLSYASGRFATKGEVRQFLESQPEFPKNNKGTVSHERANVLLKHSLYAGMIEAPSWGISLRQGKHDGIISWETYVKIQDRMNETVRVKNRIDLHEDFILRGAVDCADCDNPLTVCWSKGKLKKYPYYLCFSKGCESYASILAWWLPPSPDHHSLNKKPANTREACWPASLILCQVIRMRSASEADPNGCYSQRQFRPDIRGPGSGHLPCQNQSPRQIRNGIPLHQY